MSLAHDYRAELHAQHVARRRTMAARGATSARSATKTRTIALVHTVYVGDQSEHVKLWLIAKALREARPQWRVIADEVAAKHGVTLAEICGPHRFARLQPARREMAYRLRSELGMSFPQIGRRIGGRDHSTIRTSIGRHIDLVRGGQ